MRFFGHVHWQFVYATTPEQKAKEKSALFRNVAPVNKHTHYPYKHMSYNLPVPRPNNYAALVIPTESENQQSNKGINIRLIWILRDSCQRERTDTAKKYDYTV